MGKHVQAAGWVFREAIEVGIQDLQYVDLNISHGRWHKRAGRTARWAVASTKS
jgi:hypothetical protein